MGVKLHVLLTFALHVKERSQLRSGFFIRRKEFTDIFWFGNRVETEWIPQPA
jgi:hypothetical protein